MVSVWRPSQLSRAQLEERRLQAQPVLLTGEASTREIAEHFGVSPATVRGWRKKLRDRGEGALQATRSSGRPTRLSAVQRADLVGALRQGALAHGFDTHAWTCPRVTTVIEQLFGVTYHHDHVRKLLHALGWSAQQPDVRAMERDEQSIATWVETVPPMLEKKDRLRRDRRVSGRERLQSQSQCDDDMGATR